MAYASRSGRARVSASNPQAFAVCQRCGIWHNRVDLTNQYRWQGAALLPLWRFVCKRCLDVPNENERVIVIPADPLPIELPFPEDFTASMSVMGLAGGTVDAQTGLTVPGNTAMQTVNGVVMSPEPVGRPPGYYALDRAPVVPNDVVVFMAEVGTPYMAKTDGTYMATEVNPGAPAQPPAVPPLQDDANYPPQITYGAPLPVVSMIANGTPVVTCTCNGPHGLSLNSQVGVRGTENPLADGVFSVIPLTATAFSYGCYSPIDAGSILGPETRVVTAIVGLPRQTAALPQVGQSSWPNPTKTGQ